jgi:membrane protein CcdC involved in cytochrome C biogenesis
MMTVIGPLLTLALVLAYRLRRRSSERPLSRRFLWLAPAIYLAAVAAMLVTHPPPPLGWALLGLGLAVGAAAGWARGRLFALRLDEDSGEVLLRRSRWAVTMLVAIVSTRFLANLWLGAPHNALLVTDLMLGLVFGLVAVTRLEIALRARRLLKDGVEQGVEAF